MKNLLYIEKEKECASLFYFIYNCPWINPIFYIVLSSISGEVSEPCPGGPGASLKYLRFDDKVSNQEAANRCAAIGAVLPYVGEQDIWDVSSNTNTACYPSSTRL